MYASTARQQVSHAMVGHLLMLVTSCLLCIETLNAGETSHPTRPRTEAEMAMLGFRLPHNMKVELFAAEPLLANPVAFCIDEQGRFLVAETYRQQKGVEDNRYHMDWLLDDLALETVEERLKMFQKHLGEKIDTYDDEQDLLRLVEDTDGDGQADRSTVFAEGFNGVLEGTGAGVLSRRGQVYYTCIPKLWMLEDKNGDRQAENRTPLHHGYGVRVAFRGHDLHGLRFGPDGKLYFSIGDRGFHIETQDGRTLAKPDTGAVFRCNANGSDLEVFAFGFRNPQELAFDEFGNLFTCDNNSDSGDEARWVYVAEGADFGWRMYYQYFSDRGPWNREKLWYPHHDGQPAYIVPPVANLSDGPSGLTYYPGVGLPDRYRGHFFLADFRGTTALSGIRSLAVKPQGATFQVIDSHEFIWSILATDVDFGYDGSLYVTDWVHGWEGAQKGRIYRFTHPSSTAAAGTRNAMAIMRKGFTELTTAKLVDLLSHPDIRLRQEAQFELADRQAAELAAVAASNPNRLARLHGIWGLGQIARLDDWPIHELLPLLDDPDAEVRAQTAKVLGEAPSDKAFDSLRKCLRDEAPRVKYFAALALGKSGRTDAVPDVLDMLVENNDADALLRHAGAMALTWIADEHGLLTAAKHSSRAARMGAILALRRLESPQITTYLQDSEQLLVEETVRAIHDIPMESALPEVASLTAESNLSDALLRRVLNANYRLGGIVNARRVVAVAMDATMPDTLRLEALEALATWGNPHPLDRVLGCWRPLEPRPSEFIAEVLHPAWDSLLSGPAEVRSKAIEIALTYEVSDIVSRLHDLLTDKETNGQVRADALTALAQLDVQGIASTLEWAVRDHDRRVRTAAKSLVVRTQPDRATVLLATVLRDGDTLDKQQAIKLLASLASSEADAILSLWLELLISGDAPPEIRLDLLEAAKQRETPQLQQQLDRLERTRNDEGPLAAYRETLIGGDAQRGRGIFQSRSELSCQRCHKIAGRGGDVGPDLSRIGKDKSREYLLESLVLPNNQIAKGFESAVLLLESGQVATGIVKKEERDLLHLMLSDGSVQIFAKSDIEERIPSQSAMPANLIKQLSKSEIRDLVEYLSSLGNDEK